MDSSAKLAKILIMSLSMVEATIHIQELDSAQMSIPTLYLKISMVPLVWLSRIKKTKIQKDRSNIECRAPKQLPEFAGGHTLRH